MKKKNKTYTFFYKFQKQTLELNFLFQNYVLIEIFLMQFNLMNVGLTFGVKILCSDSLDKYIHVIL